MKNIASFLIITFLFCACTTPNYLSSPKDFKYHVKGLFLEFKLDKKTKIIGEIIEVNSDYVIILPVDSHIGIQTIFKDRIEKADVIVSLTSDNPKKINTWAGLMPILSLGHGYWGVFTLPINLAVAVPMSNASMKGTYAIKYPDNISWDDMSKFARFPQGIPRNIKLESIR